MALAGILGFGHGTVAGIATGNTDSRYVSAQTGVAVSTSSPKHGTYSASFTGSSVVRNVQLNSSLLVGLDNVVVASGYLYFITSLPTVGADCFVVPTLAGDLFIYFKESNSKMAATWEGGSEVEGPVVAANTWYHFDISVDTSANPSRLKWKVDSVAQTDVTISQAATTISNFTDGRVDSGTSDNRYNSWVYSLTAGDYPLGPHKVLELVADTGGTATEIGTANALCRFTLNGTVLDTTFNSTDILAAVSDLPPTIGATASGVYQRTSGSGNFVRIPMTSYTLAAGESIAGLRPHVTGWAGSTTANNLVIRAFDGTNTDTIFASADPNFDNSTTTPGWVCKMYTPSGGWSQAKLDALNIDIGGSTDISPVPGAHFIGADLAIKLSLSATVGQVVETDTAQAITAKKIRAVGQVTETDTAQAITEASGLTATVSTATETDTAQAISAHKYLILGAVTETNTARAIGPVHVQAVGRVAETNTSQAVSVKKTLLVGQVTETDAARGITGAKVRAVGQVTETDTARNLTSQKLLAVGQVVETDAARALAVNKTLLVDRAVETDAALIITSPGDIVGMIDQVIETDTAQDIVVHKKLILTGVTEIDLAQSIAHARSATVGQVIETDFAQAILARKTLALGRCTEVDMAQAITVKRTLIIGQVIETDTARSISRSQLVSVGRASEIDTAQALTHRKYRVVGQVVEEDTARPITNQGVPEVGLVNKHVSYLLQKTVGGNAQYVKRRPSTVTALAADTNPRLRVGHTGEAYGNASVGVPERSEPNANEVAVYVRY